MLEHLIKHKLLIFKEQREGHIGHLFTAKRVPRKSFHKKSTCKKMIVPQLFQKTNRKPNHGSLFFLFIFCSLCCHLFLCLHEFIFIKKIFLTIFCRFFHPQHISAFSLKKMQIGVEYLTTYTKTLLLFYFSRSTTKWLRSAKINPNCYKRPEFQ